MTTKSIWKRHQLNWILPIMKHLVFRVQPLLCLQENIGVLQVQIFTSDGLAAVLINYRKYAKSVDKELLFDVCIKKFPSRSYQNTIKTSDRHVDHLFRAVREWTDIQEMANFSSAPKGSKEKLNSRESRDSRDSKNQKDCRGMETRSRRGRGEAKATPVYAQTSSQKAAEGKPPSKNKPCSSK